LLVGDSVRVRRERPQCRPQLDVGAGLGRAWAKRLLNAALECRSDAPLQSFELVAAELPLVAPAEHHETQPQQAAPDLPSHALALADSVEVAQQVRPAHLAPLGIDECVARVPICRDHRCALRADEIQDHIPGPRRVDGEHRQQRLHLQTREEG